MCATQNEAQLPTSRTKRAAGTQIFKSMYWFKIIPHIKNSVAVYVHFMCQFRLGPLSITYIAEFSLHPLREIILKETEEFVTSYPALLPSYPEHIKTAKDLATFVSL